MMNLYFCILQSYRCYGYSFLLRMFLSEVVSSKYCTLLPLAFRFESSTCYRFSFFMTPSLPQTYNEQPFTITIIRFNCSDKKEFRIFKSQSLFGLQCFRASRCSPLSYELLYFLCHGTIHLRGSSPPPPSNSLSDRAPH